MEFHDARGAEFVEMTPEQQKALAKARARLRQQEIPPSEPYKMKPFVPSEPGFVAKMGRGISDITQGVEQIGRRVFGDDQDTAQWEAQKNAELQMYEQGAGPGFDGGRMLGNIVATAPLALIPGGAAAGVTTRVAAGAGAGALGSGATYVDTSQGDYTSQKAIQGTIGAVTGGVAGAVMPAVARGVGQVAQRLRGIAARLNLSSADDVVVTITRQAADSGIDLASLPDQVRQSFVDEAINQLDATGRLDMASLARRAQLERFGFTGDRAGTVGQITQDPTQWRQEFALKQMNEVGQPLTDRFRAQNARIHEVAGELADSISPARDTQAIGLNAREVAQDVVDRSQNRVSAAYRAARNSPGVGDLVADAEGMRGRLTEVYDAYADSIPSNIKTRIERLVDGAKAPTVENLDEAIRLINKRRKFANPAEQAAVGELRSVLVRQLDRTAREGGEAAEGLRRAARLAARRFGFIRGDINQPSKIIEILDGGGRADNLVDRLMTGNVDDLDHLRRFFTEFDQEAFPRIPAEQMRDTWNQIRGGVLRKINDAADVGTRHSPAQDLLKPNAWFDKWHNLGETRQRIFFSDQERETISAAIDVGRLLISEPPHTVANRSGTGGMMHMLKARTMQALQRIPGIGAFANGFAGFIEAGEQIAVRMSNESNVNVSLSGRTYTEAQRRAFEAEALTLLNRLGQVPSAATGAASAVGINSALNPSAQPANTGP